MAIRSNAVQSEDETRSLVCTMSMELEVGDLVRVPDRLQFDAERLRAYLQGRLQGFACQRGGLIVRQFK